MDIAMPVSPVCNTGWGYRTVSATKVSGARIRATNQTCCDTQAVAKSILEVNKRNSANPFLTSMPISPFPIVSHGFSQHTRAALSSTLARPCVGTDEARNAIDVDPQIRRRFDDDTNTFRWRC